jgi:hypothetical protein
MYNLDVDLVAVATEGTNLHGAITEGEQIAIDDVLEKCWMVDLDNASGTPVVADNERESCSLDHCDALFGDLPHPNLGTGQIDEDPDRTSLTRSDIPDPMKPLETMLDAAVGKIDPSDIHAGDNERSERGVRLRGRANSGDDLGSAGHRP